MPIGISILIVYILSKITLKYVNSLLKQRDIRPFIRKCVISSNGKKSVATGFIDSGNLLYLDDGSCFVTVISKNLEQKLKVLGILKIPIKSMSFSTVAGENNMNVYMVDSLTVYNGVKGNIYKRAYLGASNVNFNENGEYELLLSPSMF
jgi:hypothetical protein